MSTPHKQHNPGFLALVDDAKSRVKQVNIDRYRKDGRLRRGEHLLIDVREDQRMGGGHAWPERHSPEQGDYRAGYRNPGSR